MKFVRDDVEPDISFAFFACLCQMTADLDFPSYSSGGQLVQVAETCCNLFMSSLPYIQDLDAREAGPVDNAIGVATMALLSAHCEDLEGNLHIWQASECYINMNEFCKVSCQAMEDMTFLLPWALASDQTLRSCKTSMW